MNMDYKLGPITDEYATNLVRNAFTHFVVSESDASMKKDFVWAHNIINHPFASFFS